MVPGLSIIFSLITLILSLVLPVLLAVWFCRKYKAPATTVLLGALTFLVFQLVLRLPLLQILNPYYPGTESTSEGWNLVLYSAFLAVTAALFEEGGRVLIYKLFLRKKGDWTNAVAFGIGHGGFEAMSLIGLTYISNLVLMILINMGIMGLSDNELMNQAIQLLIQTSPWMFLLAGVERLFAMILHIGFSVLVVYGLASRRYQFVFYAFLAHFVLNFPLAFLQKLPGGIFLTMAFIGVMALFSVYWIVRVSPSLFRKLQPESEIVNEQLPGKQEIKQEDKNY
ncbi:MAG: YhfC family intramembrane metalloprotease [Caldicoprobacterales bacterium]|jgi:uncharacterized membrane protein YhfC